MNPEPSVFQLDACLGRPGHWALVGLRRRSAVISLGLSTVAWATRAAAADCNGNSIDDAIDVAPAGFGLGLRAVIATLEYPRDLALLDADGDGILDLLVASAAETPGLYHRGEGGFRWATGSPWTLDL